MKESIMLFVSKAMLSIFALLSFSVGVVLLQDDGLIVIMSILEKHPTSVFTLGWLCVALGFVFLFNVLTFGKKSIAAR